MTGTDSRRPTRPLPLRLVHSELLKIRTTHGWWLLILLALALTGLTLLINMLQAMFMFEVADQDLEGVTPEQAEAIQAQGDPVSHAANLYTSGQFLVLILVLVVGIMVVTNEYHHQTVTASFLVTPRRTQVILAKVAAATLLAGCYWLLTTLLNLPLTVLFLRTQGMDSHLTNPEVVTAILLNLAAYLLWAIFGVGFGVLLRSQILATVIGIVLYLAGYLGGSIIFSVLAKQFNAEWILRWQVLVPSIASQLMVAAGDPPPGNPAQWVGAAVLAGWAAVAGTVGVLITRRRDIT